jgi:putative redox protein
MAELAARARRLDGYRHAVSTAGFDLIVDEPESNGGKGAGPSPTNLLAAALASCTATTMEMYADRKGWDLDGVAVTVNTEGKLSKNDRTYEVVLELPDSLDGEQRERLAKVAAKCPVHKAIATSIPVTIVAAKGSA